MNIILGVIGSDCHSVGNKILEAFFSENGFHVINLGVMVSQDEFIDAAIESDAKAILVSSLYGHGEIDCAGLRDRCVERGLQDIVLYVLERLDYTWERSRYEGLANDLMPSEIFADHIWVCIIADRYAIRNRDLIGVDKLMWEADFPHNDSNWPNSRKLFADHVVDVPDDEVRLIAEDNARALYRFPRA